MQAAGGSDVSGAAEGEALRYAAVRRGTFRALAWQLCMRRAAASGHLLQLLRLQCRRPKC